MSKIKKAIAFLTLLFSPVLSSCGNNDTSANKIHYFYILNVDGFLCDADFVTRFETNRDFAHYIGTMMSNNNKYGNYVWLTTTMELLDVQNYRAQLDALKYKQDKEYIKTLYRDANNVCMQFYCHTSVGKGKA